MKEKKSVWTPVQLNEAVLAGDIDGLVGIEELKDYQIEESNVKPLKKSRIETIPVSKGLKNRPCQIKGLSCVLQRCKPNHLRPLKHKPKKLKSNNIDLANVDPAREILLKPAQSDCRKTASYRPNHLGFHNNCSLSDNENLDLLPWSLLYVPTPVAKALVELGFKEPTEIQRLSIPPAIKGRRDILGAAETGSGKTLAFGIPIIYGILKNLEKDVRDEDPAEEDSFSESDAENIDHDGTGCVRVVNLGKESQKLSQSQKLWALILTPTRELAVQVKDHLVAALKYTDLKVVVVVGGMSAEKQQRLLRQRPHIVVATPGRLWELICQGEPHLANVEDIRFLAIDEADRMTEINHFPELRSLLERLNIDHAKQKMRQSFVFSATLTLVHDLPLHTKLKNKKSRKKLILSPDDKLKNLIRVLGITNPKIIDVTRKTGTTELLTESCIVCSLHEKDYYLLYFIERHPGRTLVFCNSISCVRRLASLLSILGAQPLPLHANMVQKQRLKNLERFRANPKAIMLATDVAARGLDIPNVEHVIHYQVPRTSETYVHRSGRTARANHEGLTLLLVESGEQRQYLRLLRTLHREKELPPFPIVGSQVERVKERVNLARDIDKVQLEYKKAAGKATWMEKAAEEMDLLLDPDEMPERASDRTVAIIKRSIAVRKKQLAALSKESDLSLGLCYKYPILSENIKTTAGSFQSSQLRQPSQSSAIETVKSAVKTKSKQKKAF